MRLAMHHKNRLFVGLLVSAFAFSVASEASARSFRVNDIPNGSQYQCLSCHTSNSGHNDTSFGNDARSHLASGSTSSAHENWATLCPLDSDGDGFTNGQELGDPNCTWTRGSANPPGPTSNPGNPNSVPPIPAATCGNGKLDTGEKCDGTLMTATMCSAIGAGNGTLKCASNCAFDTSQCSSPPQSSSAGVTTGSGSGPSAGSGNNSQGSGDGSSDGGAGGGFGEGADADGVPVVLPGACSISPENVSTDATSLGLGSLMISLAWVLRRRMQR